MKTRRDGDGGGDARASPREEPAMQTKPIHYAVALGLVALLSVLAAVLH